MQKYGDQLRITFVVSGVVDANDLPATANNLPATANDLPATANDRERTVKGTS
jgi:hypothetical protein